jgi:hypothetical protein
MFSLYLIFVDNDITSYIMTVVGLEPCNYIRGFILLKYTKRLNGIFRLCQEHFLKIIVTELA